MMLPLLISVPHAGLQTPPELEGLSLLTTEKIANDSDRGADIIYALETHVAAYVAGDIARVFVDLNRPEEDRGPDGVVKTHTCQKESIYRDPLPEDLVEVLLARYHRPYHNKLSEFAGDAKLGVDCHTMLEFAPPAASDPGSERPHVCLSDAGGTCPKEWFERLTMCFKDAFGSGVAVNEPFTGGYIIRSHACELPWVQIELSRASFISEQHKHQRVAEALTAFCRSVF